MRPKVFVARKMRDAGLNLVLDFCDADVWDQAMPPTRDVLLEKVRGVDGFISMLTDRVDAELLDAAGSQLKVVSNHAVGFDNIVVPDVTARGIPIGNTPGILTDATADIAFALLLAAGRRIVESERYIREGKWKTWHPSMLLGMDMAGKTLGIVGFGRIGRAVAKRAVGFGLRIIFYSPSAEPEFGVIKMNSLDELLNQSDFVSVHTPLNAATRHMVNADFLS